jgi:membrane associated rhomboid family serine protease
MAATRRSLRALFGELRRRHVVRVASIYIVGAWAVLQAADVLGPDLGFPDGTVGVLFWVALAGLGGTVALTWFFERTPEGVTEGSRGSAPRPTRG